MSVIDIVKSCLDSITQLSEHIEGAVVYLDAGCTESFQFAGAFPVLLEIGAQSVCSLENMSALDVVASWDSNAEPARKIAVITSRLLSDAHRYILRCLNTHRGVRKCSIFTSISEIAHSAYPDSPLGPDAYHEYEVLLLQDYEELVKKCETRSGYSEDSNSWASSKGKEEGLSDFTFEEKDSPTQKSSLTGKRLDNDDFYKNDIGNKLVISVHHFPMILSPFSPRVFVLPSEGSVAEASLSASNEDSLSAGLPPISTGIPPQGEDVPPGALLTAHFLYHLIAKLELKTEIFSFGDLSKAVGKIMTDMSSLYDVGRRKRSVGLLLVDRTLDLLTPCCHGDSLVDRMFSSLPRKDRTTSNSNLQGPSKIKLGHSSLQHLPLDVQIPVKKILRDEDCPADESWLLKSIESFLEGWDARASATLVADFCNRVCNAKSNEKSNLSKIEVLDGSFVSTETFRGTPIMESILDRRTKDGLLLIKKWLQEILRRENININVKGHPGFTSKLELQTMISALAKSQSSLIRNRGTILMAAAALFSLDESHASRWEAFISAEKMLNASVGDTSQSLAAQIRDIIDKSALVGLTETAQGLLSLQDALLLVIVGYIIAGENFPTSGSTGPFSWQEEHFLKEAIVDAILEYTAATKLKFLDGLTEELESNAERKKSKGKTEESADHVNIDDFDDDDWGKWGDEEEDSNEKNKDMAYSDMQLKLEVLDRLDNLFKFLHKLSALRTRNLPLREGAFTLETNFSGDPESNKGLLCKLLTRVLGKYEVLGLEYHSSTVGRLFKSGFGRFGLGQAKPSLADQNVILVFVIGGINAIEVREVQEALAESGRPDIELIIGGTTFLTPDNMVDLLLGQYSYM